LLLLEQTNNEQDPSRKLHLNVLELMQQSHAKALGLSISVLLRPYKQRWVEVEGCEELKVLTKSPHLSRLFWYP
jgi:hypothetical protein